MEQKDILFLSVSLSNSNVREKFGKDTVEKVQDIIEECPNCEQTMYNSECQNCGYGATISDIEKYFLKDEGKEKNDNIFKIPLEKIYIQNGFYTATFDSVHSEIGDENKKSVLVLNIGKQRYRISITYDIDSEMIFIKRTDRKIKNGWKKDYLPLTNSLNFAIKSIIFNNKYNTHL